MELVPILLAALFATFLLCVALVSWICGKERLQRQRSESFAMMMTEQQVLDDLQQRHISESGGWEIDPNDGPEMDTTTNINGTESQDTNSSDNGRNGPFTGTYMPPDRVTQAPKRIES